MKFRLLIAASAFASAVGCAGLPGGAPAPGTPITQAEQQQGAQAHSQMLEAFGGAYAGPQAAYVARVGQRIAVESGLGSTQGAFTVTLLNSPVENAFALPGGYVYITRDLVALMNSEAELASVMGHEVGHVAARHSARRNSTNTIGQVLAAGLGILTGSSGLANVAGQAAQLYTLRFSREQEFEADQLGVNYLVGADYDPMASANMLTSLAAQTSLDAQISGGDARSAPEWSSTHPDPASRVARARQLAQGAAGTGSAMATNRDAFLDAIDGMMYGDDPRQGVIEGESFLHPELRLRFSAPRGYTMQNGARAVSITGQGGQAQFGGGSNAGNMTAYIDSVFRGLAGGQGAVNRGEVQNGQINGLPTARATARMASGQSQVDVTVVAYDFGGNSKYHFVLVTPAGSGVGPFAPMVASLSRLSAGEAAAIRPRMIDVVTVSAGDTLTSLSQRMAYGDYRAERFRVLNGLGAGDTLRAGQRVKLVVYGS